MHVAQIVPTLSGGGAESLVRAVVGPLAQRGVRVSVISIYPSQLEPDERAALGVPVYEIGRAGMGDALPAFRRTVALLRELQPDVVHGHVHTGKYFGRAAARAAGVPHIVYTEHHPRPERTLLQRLADRALRPSTDAVIAFHDPQRREIAERDAFALDRIAVVPNGIVHTPPPDPAQREAARAALGLAPEAFVVLFAARLADQKDPELAVDGFAALAPSRQRPGSLIIAGDGPLAERVARHAAPLGRAVRLLGYRRDVRTLYAAADAFLFTSRYEAMPLAPIEAMSQGVPVVTTPWNGAHALFDDGRAGYIAIRRDAAALALALAAVRDLPAATRAMAAYAAERARASYDIARTAEQHERLYRSLVAP